MQDDGHVHGLTVMVTEGGNVRVQAPGVLRHAFNILLSLDNMCACFGYGPHAATHLRLALNIGSGVHN